MILEEQVLKLVVDEFGRRVVVALYLIAHHLYLLVYLRLRIGAGKDNVGEQVDGATEMLLHDHCVVDGMLLVGEGIEVAADAFETVENLQGAAAFGAFERQMLAEMGQPFLAWFLVARTGSNGIAAVDHARLSRKQNDAQSVV